MSAIRIKTEIKKTVPWKLVIIFLCFSAAVILLGITLYTSERNLIFKEQGNSLKAIASLKIRQIEQWHSERIADAIVIKNDLPLIRSIRQFLNSGNNDLRIEISRWMKSVLNGYDYSNVLLIDTLHNVRLTVSQSDIVPGDVIKKDLKEVLINHNIIMTDLHRSEDIPWIHLDILVPLIDSVRKKEIPVGIIILRVSPEKILFPLIQSWPIQSKSSETLLVRKEGDSVLFLNELRHRQNTALNLRFSIKNGSLPASKAVNGVLGLVQGMDYRNIPVVAWLADVPDFSWKMVAKVDKEEILLPLKRYTILIFITVVLLILINASLFGFWIWQQRISSYKKLLQNEKSIRELEERFTTAFRMSPVSITLSSMIDDKFIDVNSTFLKDIEYTLEEVIGKTPRELDIWADEDERLLVKDEIREKGEIFARIISFKSRSGKIIYGLSSISVVKVNGQPCNLSTIVNITERMKTEEELRESEERFRSLYENVSIGIYRTTLDGRILMANPAMINMLGFDSFEQLTQRNLELEGYEPGHPRSEFLETIEKQGKVVGMESAWQQRNGKTLFVRENANAIRDAQGRVLYYDGTVEDITDRKKTEEALRDSEERFSKSFRSSPISFIIADIEDGKIIEVNDAFTTISGFTREEAIGMTTINLGIWVHEHDRDRIVDSLRKGNAVLHQETQLRAKDGKVQIVLLSAQVIKLANRNCIISSIEDITERKRAEEALQESEERFRSMANSIPQLAWVARADGFIYWYNQRWYEYTGTKPEQMEGWGWQIVHDPVVLPKVMEKWTGSIASGQSFEMSFPLRGADGQFRTFLTRVYPWKDSEGHIVQWFGTNTDVETLMRAEEMINQLNEELEQKVIKRTELLEAANKELEAFSYSVSHDLRAPLRSVHGYTKILIEEYEDKLDDEGKRICGIISSSATQMGELIDDLLNFSRIGRSSLNPLLLDMKSIVISVFADISSAKEKSRTKLKIGKLHKAFGDANLIKLVWNNLISNAIKYSSKQNISEIAVSSQLKYDRITYSVKDNGVGFDMNYKHKLFGVFQRLHGESEFEGNGVGLAIVQRIILKHGGTVWAEGEEGKGATFYFSLPVQDKRQK